MRRTWLVVPLSLGLFAGCQQAIDDEKNEKPKTLQQYLTTPDKNPPPAAKKDADGTTGTVGGAVQAVRGAVRRTVEANDLANLRIYIENASIGSSDGQMPTKDEILRDIAREMPKLVEAIKEGTLVLTGIKRREGVWAYEKSALDADGMVLTNNGVERMTSAQLKALLPK